MKSMARRFGDIAVPALYTHAARFAEGVLVKFWGSDADTGASPSTGDSGDGLFPKQKCTQGCASSDHGPDSFTDSDEPAPNDPSSPNLPNPGQIRPPWEIPDLITNCPSVIEVIETISPCTTVSSGGIGGSWRSCRTTFIQPRKFGMVHNQETGEVQAACMDDGPKQQTGYECSECGSVQA
jgi:hypothetical protein